GAVHLARRSLVEGGDSEIGGDGDGVVMARMEGGGMIGSVPSGGKTGSSVGMTVVGSSVGMMVMSVEGGGMIGSVLLSVLKDSIHSFEKKNGVSFSRR
ncbi:hypothetical protein Tco_0395491, partial [Tanacetum coccineum]